MSGLEGKRTEAGREAAAAVDGTCHKRRGEWVRAELSVYVGGGRTAEAVVDAARGVPGHEQLERLSRPVGEGTPAGCEDEGVVG